jgi:recombination protein RecT
MATANAPAPAESKALTTREHMNEIRNTLLSSQNNLLALLPATLRNQDTIRRFIEGVNFAVWKQPSLALANRASLISAVIYCVRMGLEPGAEDGCALVPFKGKVTPIPQYKGLIKRATETGSVKDVSVYLVYQNDQFVPVYGTNPKIEHTPTPLGQPKGDVIGVYVVYTMPDGSHKFEIMDEDEVKRIRNMAAAYKSKPNEGPWAEHFWAMGKKTVIRQGFKTIPVNTELRRLLETDARIEGGEAVTEIVQELNFEEGEVIDGSAPEGPKTQAQKLAETIGAEVAGADPGNQGAAAITQEIAATVAGIEGKGEAEKAA